MSNISIVLPTFEQHSLLERHLPLLLSQREVDYDIVVVDMNSRDNTPMLLDRLTAESPQLRVVHSPHSARDISQERLALLLGIKAAMSPRILVMQADVEVPDELWLSRIDALWQDSYTMLLVSTELLNDGKRLAMHSVAHERWRQRLYLKQAAHEGIYRAGWNLVCFRREQYLAQHLSATLLSLKTGALDIFVAHTASSATTLVVGPGKADPLPRRHCNYNRSIWRQRRLFDVETRRHLTNISRRRTSYIKYVLLGILRGSLLYMAADVWDAVRWSMTPRSTFVKKHY